MSILSPLLMHVSQPRQYLCLVLVAGGRILGWSEHLQPLQEQSILCIAFGWIVITQRLKPTYFDVMIFLQLFTSFLVIYLENLNYLN
jgi:hypothetical protein